MNFWVFTGFVVTPCYSRCTLHALLRCRSSLLFSMGISKVGYSNQYEKQNRNFHIIKWHFEYDLRSKENNTGLRLPLLLLQVGIIGDRSERRSGSPTHLTVSVMGLCKVKPTKRKELLLVLYHWSCPYFKVAAWNLVSMIISGSTWESPPKFQTDVPWWIHTLTLVDFRTGPSAGVPLVTMLVLNLQLS